MLITRRTLLISAPLAFAIAGASRAMTSPIYVEDGIAVDGSDVVAYFTQSKPVPGSADFSYDWMGAKWLFSSAENRDMFAANPEAYAPQFGGYCAYAVSQGYTAPTVPEAWTVYDGKLYLNFSMRAQELWSQDIPGNIAKGNENWPGVLN